MRNTQPIPTCPQCGAPVYRTHTCRASGLRRHHAGQLPEAGEVLPAARPLQLVPMPDGWRDQLQLHKAPSYDDVPATWPPRAQLWLVEDEDLDWDGPEAGHVSVSAVLTMLALTIGTAAVVLVDRLVTL